MKKPNKKEVIGGIQFFLMLLTMDFGFWFIYLLIWLKCGLPQEWGAFPITALLGLLSMCGLCTWICKGGVNNA